jgi:uroporphyrinogen-III decarboxylase
LDGYQVFSGKSDPVTVIQNGTFDLILESVRSDFIASKGRCIVSAGCEITPETTVENMQNFKKSACMLFE